MWRGGRLLVQEVCKWTGCQASPADKCLPGDQAAVTVGNWIPALMGTDSSSPLGLIAPVDLSCLLWLAVFPSLDHKAPEAQSWALGIGTGV